MGDDIPTPPPEKPHLGDRLLRWIERDYGARVDSRTVVTIQRLVEGWIPQAPDPNAAWGENAEWTRLHQEPLRARALLRWTALILVLLLIWAAFAHVDEVTKGRGTVIPSAQLQVVQSVDGGVVEKILVHEGETVQAGQLLLRIDPTRFESTFLDNRSQYVALKIKAARLEALIDGKPFDPPAKEAGEAPGVVDRERALYLSSRAELEAGVAGYKQAAVQRQQDIEGATARFNESSKGLALASQELDRTRPLVSTGAVSEVEVLRLEREVNQLKGTRDVATTQIDQARAALSEANHKVQEYTLSVQNRWSTDLNDTMTKLSSLSQTGSALADRVKKAEIRAPMRGTIKRILVNTIGGVVNPAQNLIEIVPLDDTLLLETKVSPRDIAFIRPQQKAMVKFTAYDFSIYGGLEGEVEQISADTVVDDKTPDREPYYLVRVRTHKTSLGDNLPIIPGMIAEVDIVTGHKTVLSYLLKPVLRAHANALRER